MNQQSHPSVAAEAGNPFFDDWTNPWSSARERSDSVYLWARIR
jgi:hypothetical protein